MRGKLRVVFLLLFWVAAGLEFHPVRGEHRNNEIESCGIEKFASSSSAAPVSHLPEKSLYAGGIGGRRGYYSNSGTNPRRAQHFIPSKQIHHPYGRSNPLEEGDNVGEEEDVRNSSVVPGRNSVSQTSGRDTGTESEGDADGGSVAESRGYGGEGEEMLVCQIRTLHSELNIANLTSSVPGKSAERIVKLRLECNDLLFFESFLVSGQLSAFRNLEKLEIKKCKLSELSEETFKGLEHLRTLRIHTGNSDWAPRSLRITEGGFKGVGNTLETVDLGFNNIWALPTGFLCQLRNARTLNLTHNLLSNINDLGFGRWKAGGVVSEAGISSSGEEEEGVGCRGSQLRYVDLSWNGIQGLEGTKLGEMMKRLEVLRLDQNRLREIPPEAFNGLEELMMLNLSSNQLLSLPHNLFHGTRNLRELLLRNNSLTELTSVSLLNHLEFLQVLDLSWNKLSGEWVTLGVFHQLYRLVILNLSHNSLNRISPLAFRDLSALQSLDLSFNMIYAVEEGSFARCSNLHVLNLSNNRLKTIGSWTLSGLGVLRKLYLDDNEIGEVAPDAFVNVTSLQDLGLANNRLTRVPGSLRYLKRLQTLDLGENRLSSIGNDTWYGLSQLYGLRLVGNELEEIPVGFCQFIRRLRALNLAGNRIGKISLPAFRSCPDLRVLRLDSNNLNLLPPTLPAELPNLLWLNVSGNYIRWLDYGWLPRKLEWLDVSHNLLESLWGAPRTPPSSQLQAAAHFSYRSGDADPSHDGDQGEPGGGGGEQVQEFHQRNLEEVGGGRSGVEGAGRLAGEIWRSGRMMSMEEEEKISHVHKFPGLRVLDASYNNLTEIDHRAVGKSLEIFKASHNKINKIPPDTFSAGERLRRIELNSNLLTSLSLKSIRLPSSPPPSSSSSASNSHHHHHSNGYGRRGDVPALLDNTRPLVEIFLADNPFLCDCDMEWLTRVNQLSAFRTHPFVTDMDRIKCSLLFGRGSGNTDFSSITGTGNLEQQALLPPPTVRKTLMEMNPQDFLCSYTTHCFALCHCCEFDACDCQMNCPLGCDCYHDDNWSANVVNCAGSNHSTLPPQLPMDSTQVYLDGTRILALKPHGFIGRKNLKMLFLNGTGLETIANKSFNGLISLQYLHLENNKLSALKGYEFEHLARVKELYLHNNMLRTIENNTFLSCKALEILTLSGNQLIRFAVWQLNLNRNLIGVSLASNPWDCHCDFVELLYKWTEGNGNKAIGGAGNLKCAWVGGSSGSNPGFGITEFNKTCAPGWPLMHGSIWGLDLNTESVLFYGIVGSVLIVWIVLVLVWVFREEIKYGIFSVCGYRIPSSLCFSTSHQEGDERIGGSCFCCGGGEGSWEGAGGDCGGVKSRDAYFLYSRLDEEFVRKRIVDELEDNCGYRLVLHYRDCCYVPPPHTQSSTEDDSSLPSSTNSGPGGWGLKAMEAGIKSARVLVLVVSPNFLRSEWTNREFREIFLQSMADNKSGIESLATAHKSRLLSRAIVILRDDSEEGMMMDGGGGRKGGWKYGEKINSDLLTFLNSKKMRKRTVRWSENTKTFWRKLKFLLPPPLTPISGKTTKNSDEFTFHSGTTFTPHPTHSISPSTSSCNTSYLYVPSNATHQHHPHHPSLLNPFQVGKTPEGSALSLRQFQSSGPNSIYASPTHTIAPPQSKSHYDSNILNGTKNSLDVFNAKRMSSRESLPSPSAIRQMNQRRNHFHSINNNDYNSTTAYAPRNNNNLVNHSQPWAYAATFVGAQSPFNVQQRTEEPSPPDPPAHFQEILKNFSLQNYPGFIGGRPGNGVGKNGGAGNYTLDGNLRTGKYPGFNPNPAGVENNSFSNLTVSSRNSSPPSNATTDSTLHDSDNKSGSEKEGCSRSGKESSSTASRRRNKPQQRNYEKTRQYPSRLVGVAPPQIPATTASSSSAASLVNPAVDYSDSEHEYEYGMEEINRGMDLNRGVLRRSLAEIGGRGGVGGGGDSEGEHGGGRDTRLRQRQREIEIIRDSGSDSRSSYDNTQNSDQEHVYFTLDTPSPTHKPLINDNDSYSSAQSKPSRDVSRISATDPSSSPYGSFTKRSRIIAAATAAAAAAAANEFHKRRSDSPYFGSSLVGSGTGSQQRGGAEQGEIVQGLRGENEASPVTTQQRGYHESSSNPLHQMQTFLV